MNRASEFVLTTDLAVVDWLCNTTTSHQEKKEKRGEEEEKEGAGGRGVGDDLEGDYTDVSFDVLIYLLFLRNIRSIQT
jgi:hypothetical protein